jgi:hypothetical protein
MSLRTRLVLSLALALGCVTRTAHAQDHETPTPAGDAPVAAPTVENAAATPTTPTPSTATTAANPTTPAEVQANPADASSAATSDLGFGEQPLVLPASAGADGAAPSTLSNAELESLGLEMGSTGVDTSFHFSGFSDFTAYVPIKPRGIISLGLPRNEAFYIGNLNLYMSKNLSENWRTMAEVRFTYLPNGGPSGDTQSFGMVSTSTSDYAENGRKTRYGAIIMQRVYLEWTMHRLATLRAGQFLTPYGIWNVDHGSPAYLPVQRPYAINNNYFPERQTGLELFGRWDASNFTTFGYHLTVSNGNGPVSEYKDLDRNKAVGARLYFESHRVGYLRVGASGYYGTDTNALPKVGLSAKSLSIGDTVLLQYDALSLAADVQFKYKGLLLQGEWVSMQRRYTDQGRTVHNLLLGPAPRGFSQDSLSWGAYGLLAYQFNWYGITPYLMGQCNSEILIDPLYDTHLRVAVVHGGFNVHPIDAVTFKAEYTHAQFLTEGAFFADPMNTVQFQAAWAF